MDDNYKARARASQAIWSVYRPVRGLGDGGLPQPKEAALFRPPFAPRVRSGGRRQQTEGGPAGGMSGTLGRLFMQRVLEAIARLMGCGCGYEILDIGAGDGIVLACAFAFGAMWAIGVELKNEGQAAVFSVAQQALLEFGVTAGQLAVHYGVDVAQCQVLPSLMSGGGQLRKAVFTFCDGFSEADRAHVFQLVGHDPLVKVFVCSCGLGSGDSYGKPSDVLAALNESQRPAFRQAGEIVGKMHGSSASKSIHFFTR